MTWQTGTVDGSHELLQALIDLATNSHVDSVAVNAGGTGYAVGDMLEINGGTAVGGYKAAVEVLTVSGSAVATVRLAAGGSYTVNPGTGATTTATTGSGTGCTIDTTIASTGWTVNRRTKEAVSATIAAGGSGYAVNDELTVVLGFGGQGKMGAHAVFNVDSVSSGAVTAVSLVSAGNYEVTPTNDVSTTTDGSGTGCELTVTYQDADAQDQVVILTGDGGSGFEDPIVAIETYNQLDQFTGALDCFNWALFGLPAYNPLVALHEQPNVSPGHDTGSETGDFPVRGTPNLPLKDTDATYPITFWFSITGRRIIGVFHITDGSGLDHYPSMYLGFMNQAGTALEYPYPLYVGGASFRAGQHYSETTPHIGGISACYGSANTTTTVIGESSAFFYDSGNNGWYASLNFDVNDGGTTMVSDADFMRAGLWPLLSVYNDSDSGPGDVFGDSDDTYAFQFHFDIIDREIPHEPIAQLHPTPDGANPRYLLIPLTLVSKFTDGQGVSNPTGLNDVFGELDSCFWLSAVPAPTINTLDTFLYNGDRYRIFQNGNQTSVSVSYMAIREE